RRDGITEQRHQLSCEEQAELALLERAERDPAHLGLLPGFHKEPHAEAALTARAVTNGTSVTPRVIRALPPGLSICAPLRNELLAAQECSPRGPQVRAGTGSPRALA